jgi:Cellulose binding domain
MVYIVAAVALALSAFAGVAVALTPPRRPAAFPYLTLVTPFPSVTPGAQPGATASPRVTLPAQNGMTHPSTMPVMTASVTPSPTMTTAPTGSPSTTASPSASATQPTVTVTYLAVSDWDGDLVGEVKVTNTGYSAISGWQIVVALPDDQFTAVSGNATGYASHHILLLQPASYADSVPADGTLSVFFTAYGSQATPELCAFNNTTCQ